MGSEAKLNQQLDEERKTGSTAALHLRRRETLLLAIANSGIWRGKSAVSIRKGYGER